MKKLNSLLLITTLTLAVVPLFNGCSTTSAVSTNAAGQTVTNQTTQFLGTTVTPAGLYSQFRGGAGQAAMIALKSDPNTLPYLKAVYQVLEATVTTGNYNPAALQAAISAVPIKDIHNPAALEAISSGFAMFQIVSPFLQSQVNGKNPFILPTLQGIADGIGDALQMVQPQAPPAAPAPAATPTPAAPAPVTPRVLRPAEPEPSTNAPSTNAPTPNVDGGAKTSMNAPHARLPVDVAECLQCFSKTGVVLKDEIIIASR